MSAAVMSAHLLASSIVPYAKSFTVGFNSVLYGSGKAFSIGLRESFPCSILYFLFQLCCCDSSPTLTANFASLM